MTEDTSNFDELLNDITSYLSTIGIDDETFSEYILQIIQDDSMTMEEQIEIIVEFLQEAIENDSTELNIQNWVATIIQSSNDIKLKLKEQEERERQELIEKTKQIEITNKTTNDNTLSKSKKPELTREERIERERWLSKYGYEVEDVEENENGETEIVFRDQTGKKQSNLDDLGKNRNAELVQQKELMKKLEAQKIHQTEKMRNKELMEKQRLEKEKKKKGTQKREKVRG
ncbi:hypothetical protein HDV02_003493 [Globomyces sp. JEL0801]|nr:hypothetical protein HDV02_003493 [Globomyces sp. JEL0801]